ncbi:MAG TPA: hypothetical protein DCS93_32530 [Microscillaceae bacterium]|nr:hypothetical protein [Microscillaceae bacterium]
MNAFRGLLIVLAFTITTFTVYVISQFGLNIAPLFFGEIRNLTWAGQFNYDFLTYLWLSALWVMWRNRFSAPGIALGLVASVLGMTFFAPYVLFLTFQTKGDVKQLLLGRHL